MLYKIKKTTLQTNYFKDITDFLDDGGNLFISVLYPVSGVVNWVADSLSEQVFHTCVCMALIKLKKPSSIISISHFFL